MHIWKDEKLASTKDIEVSTIDTLEKYQVEVVPRTPFRERLKKRLRTFHFRPSFDFCGLWVWAIIGFIALEAIFVLFNYYGTYKSVYPGSKIAAAINRTNASGGAFSAFNAMICSCGVVVPGYAIIKLYSYGMRRGSKVFPLWVVLSIAILCAPLFLFLATWQIWISYMLMPVLTNRVYNTACQGWDMSANLEGISWDDQFSNLPSVGTATIVLAHGNYSMRLERNETNHDVFSFYPLNTFNYTPPFSNITYDFANATYTVDNVTTHFTLKPNLQFPSLDLTLSDASIPFESTWGPPNANLVYRNDSVQTNVFNTVTAKANDCTQLRACGMLSPKGSFDIAMGVVMIQQYYYSVACTTPQSNNGCS